MSGGYVYRAVDQEGQVIDVLVCTRRAAAAARRFFRRTVATLKARHSEVVTDAAPVYPPVLDELCPWAWRHVHRHLHTGPTLARTHPPIGKRNCALADVQHMRRSDVIREALASYIRERSAPVRPDDAQQALEVLRKVVAGRFGG